MEAPGPEDGLWQLGLSIPQWQARLRELEGNPVVVLRPGEGAATVTSIAAL